MLQEWIIVGRKTEDTEVYKTIKKKNDEKFISLSQNVSKIHNTP